MKRAEIQTRYGVLVMPESGWVTTDGIGLLLRAAYQDAGKGLRVVKLWFAFSQDGDVARLNYGAPTRAQALAEAREALRKSA